MSAKHFAFDTAAKSSVARGAEIQWPSEISYISMISESCLNRLNTATTQ